MLNPLTTNEARDKSTDDLRPYGLKKPLRSDELHMLFTKIEDNGTTAYWEQRPDYNTQLKFIAGKLE